MADPHSEGAFPGLQPTGPSVTAASLNSLISFHYFCLRSPLSSSLDKALCSLKQLQPHLQLVILGHTLECWDAALPGSMQPPALGSCSPDWATSPGPMFILSPSIFMKAEQVYN